MKKQSLFTAALVVLMSMIGAKTFAHDIVVANADGVTIYYVWTNNKTELSVSYRGSYDTQYNEYSGNVVIPSSVEYQGNTYSVTSIGYYAFFYCTGLTSVTIPNSVTSIGQYAFNGTDWYNNQYDGLLYLDNWLVGYKGNAPSGNVNIKYGTKGIARVFEDCSSITSVIIPNSVKFISYSAFKNCGNLASITIPNSVTSIESDAFYGTAWYDSQPDGLVYAGSVAYKYKGTMPDNTSISIKEGTLGITASAFENYSGLTSLTIPNSVTSIGGYAFSGCSNLKTITSEIEKPFAIPTNAFSSYTTCRLIVPVGTKADYQSTTGWSSFTDIIEPGEGGNVGTNIEVEGIHYKIGENNTVSVLAGNTKYTGDFVIPNQVTFNGKVYSVASIGESAFKDCSGLTSIKIPNSVKTIGSSAFRGCSGIFSVIIPNSVTEIGSYAFNSCTNLTSVIIGSGVTSIGSYAFNNNNIKKILWLTNTPPSGYGDYGTVNYVSNDLFTSLTNKRKYQFLSSYFDVDGIRYVPISPSEKTCDAIDCVYDESAANTKVSSTVVYKGVTLNVKNINSYLAYNNKFIKTLTVDNDGELADHVFSYCSNMKSASLGSKITAIGSHAFQGCSSIETIDIPDLVPVLNIYTFADCTSLKEIKIKPLMTDIKHSVFNNCTSLALVIFADSETELNLGSNRKEISNYPYYQDYGTPLFYSCPLDSVYIGRNINYNITSEYGYSPFYRNTSLRAVKITDKETEISENEFYGCTNLQRVVIGDGVTIIKKWAFSDCSSLLYFAFGTQVATIEQEAFSDCASVVEISSKAAIPPVCGSQALDDINKWECKLYVPDGSADSYQNADQWKDFFFTEVGEGTAGQGGGTQVKNKCEAPTISVAGDKLTFSSKTEGVLFHYSISFSDVQNGVANKDVELTKTLTVSVFATKEGYIDSEVKKLTFKVSGSGLIGDVDGNGVVNVADHVELTKIIMAQ